MINLCNLFLNDPVHTEAFRDALLSAKDGPFRAAPIPDRSGLVMGAVIISRDAAVSRAITLRANGRRAHATCRIFRLDPQEAQISRRAHDSTGQGSTGDAR
jgi:hypothetical protein